jgi:hypothetical protein
MVTLDTDAEVEADDAKTVRTAHDHFVTPWLERDRCPWIGHIEMSERAGLRPIEGRGAAVPACFEKVYDPPISSGFGLYLGSLIVATAVGRQHRRA